MVRFNGGTSYDSRTGKITGFFSKAIPVPHLNAVIACSGAIHACFGFAAFLADRGVLTFDDAADKMQDIIQDNSTHFKDTILCLVGWSERSNRMRGFGIHTIMPDENRFMGDTLKFKTFSLGMGSTMPTPADPALSDSRDIIALMQSQREATRLFDGVARHIVGGHIQEIILTKSECELRIIHRWDDEIGKYITP